MNISDLAGKPAPISLLTDIDNLIKAYYQGVPDARVATERVEFGTSGHRGSSLNKSFNEHHILAITQAICFYRKEHKIDGPLFLGIDTHALSKPAMQSALEVLAANEVEVKLAFKDEYTPTPVISHAILTYNHEHAQHLADGIVITPSHNPPAEGGFKYNPPTGGPADANTTNWIQHKANQLLLAGLNGIKRMSFKEALQMPTTKHHNYLKAYVEDLAKVIDMQAIRDANIRLGVDPLGGATVHYWRPIAERYGLNLTVTNEIVDPTFSFMTVDWDGKIRMDPSSAYAMESLLALKKDFDIAFACDTDGDRHGIVTKSSGLLPANHYLAATVYYLYQYRPLWTEQAAVGKTLVSSQMIDRVAAKLGRSLYEVPVGFKWFVDGLLDGQLAFGGEESAGASFARQDGCVWTTDKDGIIMCLLAAEMTAKLGKDPGLLYQQLTKEFGNPVYGRLDATATPAQKALLKNLAPQDISFTKLAGEEIKSILCTAPGNGAAIGGIKVATENGWFAARPSGTENIYKIYGESFLGEEHLKLIFEESQRLVDHVLQAGSKAND